MNDDLDVALRLADVADEVALGSWNQDGVPSSTKLDGSPVTKADVAVEEAVLTAMRTLCPGDGYLGEEVGERVGSTGRRWIVDGIDGTRFFASGQRTWGTLIALECDGEIVVGVSSSPAQDRRWWAQRGCGAFAGQLTNRSTAARIHVSAERDVRADRVATLPGHRALVPQNRQVIERLAGGRPPDRLWSHQNRVAEGELDICVWFCGDVWDHAAPSILVEEAGGRFSDHHGGKRLDTRRAIYSNGLRHDDVLAALTHEQRA